MEPLIIESDIGASVKTSRNQLISYSYIGISVKINHNQLSSYNTIYRNYIYPFYGVRTIRKGECFIISLNTNTNTIINHNPLDYDLLKYLINKLY